jgi:hypothetical protein
MNEERTEKAEGPPSLEGLALLLDGYFHEDFRAEHGTHEAAARAFAREASPRELRAAREALETFLAWAERVETPAWQAALTATGGSWRPRSLAPLREVLQQLR